MANRKILVTGADGFVGSNLVRELLDRKYEVVAFVQRGVDPVTLKGLPVEFRYGDLLDEASIHAAMAGCGAMVHSAALLSVWPYFSDIQRRVNVEGTANVMRAALQFKLKKIVFVGTANSYGYGNRANPGDETKPYNSGHYGLGYMDTKYEAQQLVLSMVKNDGLPAVVVNPTFMFGPFALKTGCSLMIGKIFNRQLVGYTPGGRNYVAVKDVCVGIANALERAEPGACYLLGNRNMSYQEIFTTVAKVVGVKPPSRAIPKGAVLGFGALATLAARVTGRPPEISYRMCRISLDENYYTAAKAVRELGLPQTPIEVAIQEAYDWMVENKRI